MRSSPRRFWRSRSRSSIFNGAGAASGRAPEQRLCRCPHTLQAGEAQATPPIGIGIKGRGSSPPSPPSFCPFPPSSQPHASVCTFMCAHTHVRLVCGAPLSCVCVFVWRCAIGYVVCERSQMGLKSFYLAVNCHFFFAGLRPAHPAGGHGAPQTPRVRPCSASRSPKRQVRLSAEVTSGRPTSKKTAI